MVIGVIMGIRVRTTRKHDNIDFVGATRWALSVLLPEQYVDMVIEVRPYEDCGICFKESDREFKIIIQNNQGKKQILYTLFHELVHVKQYVTKELVEYSVAGNSIYEWRNKFCLETNWDDMPWEIEAMELEVELYDQYKNHLKRLK